MPKKPFHKIVFAIVIVFILLIGAVIFFNNKSINKSLKNVFNKNETGKTVANTKQEDLPKSKSNCIDYTPATSEGNYYIANTGRLTNNNLNFNNLVGNKYKVYGYVYEGSENNKPISGAKIEIWQANADGKYIPQANGDKLKFNDLEIGLRGYIDSTDGGYFEYDSILPGEYDGRSRHVYFKVSKEGYKTVTTQLTFNIDGDKNPIEKDEIASKLLDCQNFKKLPKLGDVYKAIYHFRLEKIQ
jgi:protocatechuate 3,4-dioxygenase beta subunit